MAKTVLDVLRDRIRQQLNDYADDLATGMCTDFAEYRHLCGVIRGLATAERLLLDLADQMEHSDD
jgi:hypothetical protein